MVDFLKVMEVQRINMNNEILWIYNTEVVIHEEGQDN